MSKYRMYIHDFKILFYTLFLETVFAPGGNMVPMEMPALGWAVICIIAYSL